MSNPLALRAQRIKAVREKLKVFFDTMVQTYGGEEVIKEVMVLRGYTSRAMFNTLTEIGLYQAPPLEHLRLLFPQFTTEDYVDFGICSAEGDYFMTDRYVLPIKDVDDNIIALVGWDKNGGSRKYLTTTTFGFYRDTSFFNYNVVKRAWTDRKGIICLVEGIFDALALTSIGFPAVAAMGLELSYVKEHMLARFSKVIVIADNDRGGKTVNPYLYSTVNGITYSAERQKQDKVWKPLTLTTFVGLPDGVKDVDKYVRDYAMEEDLESLYHLDPVLTIAESYVQLYIG